MDDDPHTEIGADFDTGRMNPGELATVIFNEPGVYPCSCQFHPVMTDTVEVRDESGQGSSRSAVSTQASPGASSHATPAASGRQAAVSIIDLAFDPAALEVSVGTTVTWTNDESIPHAATSTDDAFRSDTMQLNDTFSHTFDTVGTFDYICAIHPNMQGTVMVTA